MAGRPRPRRIAPPRRDKQPHDTACRRREPTSVHGFSPSPRGTPLAPSENEPVTPEGRSGSRETRTRIGVSVGDHFVLGDTRDGREETRPLVHQDPRCTRGWSVGRRRRQGHEGLGGDRSAVLHDEGEARPPFGEERVHELVLEQVDLRAARVATGPSAGRPLPWTPAFTRVTPSAAGSARRGLEHRGP